MRKVLFISPHLDDAVFSCAIRIMREVESGADVTVATVFSHARRGTRQWQDYLARREEDRMALRELGAKPQWMGLLDAPWRDEFYNSFQRIVHETAPSDIPYGAVVRKRLNDFIHELAPDAIYLPLGVGTHIDHRLVFAAAISLRLPCIPFFYEDQPYALVHSAVQVRLTELGAVVADLKRFPSNGIARFLHSFRRAPYVRRYLPPGPERKAVEKILKSRLSHPTKNQGWQLKSEIECSHPGDRAWVLRSLHAYRSQVRLFLGSREEFATTSRRHAAALGVTADRAERYWKSVK